MNHPRRRRRLAAALGTLVAFGVAGAASASAAPPDLFPFVASDGPLQPAQWYVDTSQDGGVYSARLHFPTQLVNTGGRFKITAGAASGPPEAPVAVAVQNIDGGGALPLGPSIRLVGTQFGVGDYLWAVEGVAQYTLSPVTGALINSALAATCKEDNAVFAEPGAPAAAPSEFASRGTPIGGPVVSTANCGPGLDAAATGFSAGISTGWQDVIDLNSANSAFFDISTAAPGPGVFRARVDPNGVINQATTANDTELRPLDIPGVVADQEAAVLTTAGRAALQLSASVKSPQVRGRRVTAASPPNGADAAPAGAGVTFALADAPTGGTVTINPATGAAAYVANPGSTAADTFTYVATDTRGLRSAPAKVFVDPPGSVARILLGRPDIARNALKTVRSFRVGQKRAFTVKVPKGQKSAMFSVTWSSGKYAITLRKPGTKAIISKGRGKVITLRKARTFRAFTVKAPKAGVWRMTVVRLASGPRISKASIRVTVQRKG